MLDFQRDRERGRGRGYRVTEREEGCVMLLILFFVVDFFLFLFFFFLSFFLFFFSFFNVSRGPTLLFTAVDHIMYTLCIYSTFTVP